MSVRLIAIKCLQCGLPVPAQPADIAFGCPHCGQVALIAGDRLVPQPAFWGVPRAGVTPAGWLPFWVFAGQVALPVRETFGGLGFGDGGPDPLWQAPRRLWVPAFSLTLDLAKQWGVALTRGQPQFASGAPPAGVALSGCVVTVEDAHKLAEFVVLSIEAERKDMLKRIAIQLPGGAPELWVLPSDGRQLVAA